MPARFQCEIGGRTLVMETGDLAGQANGSVLARYGETVILVTACVSPKPREGSADFVPLTVDLEERLYAAGKIPGSFFRREGRPSTEAILTDRLTDRALRPLFPKGFRHETQVILTVLSADQENEPDTLAIAGASAALTISDIPFDGPVAAVKMGYLNGQLVVNPTYAQLQDSQLELVIAATQEAVVMVEAGAREVPESLLVEAIRRGSEECNKLVALQREMAQAFGKPKMPFTPSSVLDKELQEAVAAAAAPKLQQVFQEPTKERRNEVLATLQAEMLGQFGVSAPTEKILDAFEAVLRDTVRRNVLQGNRPDGRGWKDIRPVSCKVSLLPRTHGSGLFTRGETQVLTLTTLGSMSEAQRLDTISPEETKRFMHHYNFPPFSTGEVKRMGSAGRREIGHGALAERALSPVMPDAGTFPYTIRLVSEVVSSNGSSSMASVCGSSLSLMDAGVPIKAPVAGIAMGLVMGEEGRHAILTDIQGMEDHLGDMDFKVAGTAAGVTALQLDIKAKSITPELMAQALTQAREARLFILEKMRETIASHRPELSPHAPRMYRLTINPEKIGAVIGPGGRMIRSITEQTGAQVDIENDGTVFVSSSKEEAARKAIEMIQALTKEVEVGQVYKGKVTRTMNFGVFVELLPNKDGMLPRSELDGEVNVGDELEVKVVEIDRMGRVNLSLATPTSRGEVGATREQPHRPGSPAPRPGGRPTFHREEAPRRPPTGGPGGQWTERRRPPFRREGPPSR